MKRTICLLTVIFILFSVFADTLTSAEATLKYDLVTTSYLFGFAETESEAQKKTDAYTKQTYSLSMSGSGMDISGGSGTLYFYWKVLTGETLKITLESNGPLKHTSVGTGTPTTEPGILHLSGTAVDLEGRLIQLLLRIPPFLHCLRAILILLYIPKALAN